MEETPLKICVVGPCRSGKTLLTKIVGQQPLVWTEQLYEPSPSLRIQEASVFVDMEKIGLELWDCSGDVDCKKYWSILSQDLGGLLLVYDPTQFDGSFMEKLYNIFGQRNDLSREQCLLMATRIKSADSKEAGVALNHSFTRDCLDRYLSGKLTELPSAEVDLNTSEIELASKV